MASLTTGDKVYLTIDAGGTYIKSAVLDREGIVLEGSSFKTRSFSDGPKEVILSAFSDTITQGLKIISSMGKQLGGIGMAFPGPFDYRNGIPLMSHKFQSLYGLSLGEALSGNLSKYKNVPFVFVHDANAVLMGEQWKGNGQGFENVAVVTLGTGLGFAVSEKRKVLCNDLGGPLITIYGLPYKEGILEDTISQRGILKSFERYGGLMGIGTDVAAIGRWAEEGDRASILAFRETGSILGEALKDILSERNIQCLLFGGQISRSFSHLETALGVELADVASLARITVVKSIDFSAFWGILFAIKNN